MTGPLAQQFATVRDNTHHFSFSPRAGSPHTHDCGGCKADAALSVIERHVQDMETARALLIRLRQWDALNPLPDPIPAPFADMRYWVEEIDRTLAALPAREKGTE